MTNDQVFVREFKEMMSTRHAISAERGQIGLSQIPVPNNDALTKSRPVVYIKGIKEPFFSRLNKSQAMLTNKTTLNKRQVLSDGSFRKDDNNQYVVDKIKVPNSAVALASPISIGLKRQYKDSSGVVQTYIQSKSFRYIDYIDRKSGRVYIYVIPKTFVYRMAQVALIVTMAKRSKYYGAVKIALQNGTFCHLSIIPYSGREMPDAHLISVKATLNFTNEITHLLQVWQHHAVIFDLSLTTLEISVNGLTNIAYIELEPTLSVDDYEPVSGISLAEERVDTDLDATT
jgi:hypothetical protein